MNFVRYLKEIKNRLLLALFSWIFTSISCFYYKEMLLIHVVKVSIHQTCNKFYFIFTDVTEMFYSYTHLIFFISNQFFFVSFFYHFFMFMALGLHNSEFKKVKKLISSLLFAWFFSLWISTNYIIPFSWNFFLSFQNDLEKNSSFSLFFEAKLSEYLVFYTNLYLLCFVNCLVLIVVLVTINTLSESLSSIKLFRRSFYYIFVVFSTVTTPPDVFSQVCLSFSLILIYETFLFLTLVKKLFLIRKPIKTY